MIERLFGLQLDLATSRGGLVAAQSFYRALKTTVLFNNKADIFSFALIPKA